MNNALKNILLVLISITAVFVCFEIFLRFANYNPFSEFFEKKGRAVFIRPSKNPERIFEAAPNTQGAGWGTHIFINNFGFRGQNVSLEKPKDTYRIVVIGDSITFGNNLPADKNYPAVLETLFSKNIFLKNKRHVEVLNLGLGGYDTLQEVATLEDIGIQFKPNLVIVGYCINDIGIASGNLNYIKRLQKYGSPIYRLRLAQWIRIQLDRIELIHYTETANSKDNFLETYENTLANISNDVVLKGKVQELSFLLDKQSSNAVFTQDYTDEIHLQRLRYALEKLKTLQDKNNFDVSVLIIPYLLEDKITQPTYQAVYDIVQHEMTRLHFSTINLYPAFKTAGLSELILKESDGVHPNAQGHEIIANETYRTINARVSMK